MANLTARDIDGTEWFYPRITPYTVKPTERIDWRNLRFAKYRLGSYRGPVDFDSGASSGTPYSSQESLASEK